MKKGFTLIECIISTSVITFLVFSLLPSITLGLRANRDTYFRDYEFNMARTICERFLGEETIVQDKMSIIYVDGIDEIPDDITTLINSQINEYSIKKFKITIKGSYREKLSFINVEVVDTKGNGKGVTLYAAR